MKKSAPLIGLVLVLVAVLAGNTLFAQQPSKKEKGSSTEKAKKCCIAGTYDGSQRDVRSPTCPDPGSGNFVFTIEQDKKCGSRIWGKVLSLSDKSTMSFSGEVAPGAKGCCRFKGDLTKPGEKVGIVGTLCRKGGKWGCGDGRYRSSSGCSGTFRMSQR